MRTPFAEFARKDLKALRKLAKRNCHSEWLRRWWVHKYKISPYSSEFESTYGSYSYEELLLEYLEDLYERDKKAFDAFRAPGDEDEGFDPEASDDPIIAELERRLAAGEDIGAEDLEVLEPKKAEPIKPTEPAEKPKQEELPEAEDFEDDYTPTPANRR
jgi:hypothetical protein